MEGEDTVSLQSTEALNESITLLLIARIDERTATLPLTVLVQLQERAMIFEQLYYAALINEDAEHFTNGPLIVGLLDCDSEGVTYRLVDSTSLFAINSETGEITVQRAEYVTVDNLGQRFNLTVVAEDVTAKRSAAVDVVVTVLVRDALCMKRTCDLLVQATTPASAEAPHFAKERFEFTVTLSDLTSNQGAVGTVAMSGGPQPTFIISEGGAGHFTIDKSTGELRYNGPKHHSEGQVIYELLVNHCL